MQRRKSVLISKLQSLTAQLAINILTKRNNLPFRSKKNSKLITHLPVSKHIFAIIHQPFLLNFYLLWSPISIFPKFPPKIGDAFNSNNSSPRQTSRYLIYLLSESNLLEFALLHLFIKCSTARASQTTTNEHSASITKNYREESPSSNIYYVLVSIE